MLEAFIYKACGRFSLGILLILLFFRGPMNFGGNTYGLAEGQSRFDLRAFGVHINETINSLTAAGSSGGSLACPGLISGKTHAYHLMFP